MSRKKIMSFFLTVVIGVTMTGGCGKKADETAVSVPLPSKINQVGNTVSDIDDMEDWSGKKLNLVYWYCQGTGAPNIGKKPQNDVVRPELARATGITWDEKNSFDNNGENGDTKISKIIASGTWPDVAYNLDKNLIKKLSENDKIWDITEYIPKYMDNYMKIVNADEKTKQAFENLKVDGKMWSLTQSSSGAARYLNENYHEKDYETLIAPEETRSWIWVRDDIIKTLYPQAKTQAEIKQTYMDKGAYTKEDLCDVAIRSNAEFKELLTKINSLGLTESGRKVWPFYTHNGTDNWDILTMMNCLAGGGNGAVNYFAYYDNGQKQMVRTADQAWFKEQMRFYNSLINGGLASKEALVDNKAAFEQKKNNGEYAVIYGNTAPPTDEALKAAGKNYSYRKVLIDIPMDYSRFIKQNTADRIFDGASWTIFKTTNIQTEADLEQLLRYFDFFYSEAGMKCLYWGPRKAGLYTETEDGLKFTDPLLEEDSVYNGGNDTRVKYGFASWPSVYDFAPYASPYNPKVVYARRGERRPEQYTTAWRYSSVEPAQAYPELKVNFSLWNWTQYVDPLKKFWDARQASEDAYKLIFTAQNEDEFEKNYADMLAVIGRNGLTPEAMSQWNAKFEEINSQYIEELKAWKPAAN